MRLLSPARLPLPRYTTVPGYGFTPVVITISNSSPPPPPVLPQDGLPSTTSSTNHECNPPPPSPPQDFLTCAFLLTSKDRFYSRAEFCGLLATMADGLEHIDIPTPALIKPLELWTGEDGGLTLNQSRKETVARQGELQLHKRVVVHHHR